jgi:hypothetical protein
MVLERYYKRGSQEGKWEHTPPMSNYIAAILVDVKDRLNRNYGTYALTRIHDE